jgi:hypothetical protein
MMEAVSTSETSANFYQTTRRDSNVNSTIWTSIIPIRTVSSRKWHNKIYAPLFSLHRSFYWF